ncbi:MAG: hypothetical protein JWM63_4016 [Gammaproteobacteria bacterium]|nr:hypothetical protein [Gammaproteobacteria bacterium]
MMSSKRLVSKTFVFKLGRRMPPYLELRRRWQVNLVIDAVSGRATRLAAYIGE